MKATFKLKDYEKFYLNKFLNNGECVSPAALGAVIRYCDKATASSALEGFKKYCWSTEGNFAAIANMYELLRSDYNEGTPEYFAHSLAIEIFNHRAAIESTVNSALSILSGKPTNEDAGSFAKL